MTPGDWVALVIGVAALLVAFLSLWHARRALKESREHVRLDTVEYDPAWGSYERVRVGVSNAGGRAVDVRLTEVTLAVHELDRDRNEPVISDYRMLSGQAATTVEPGGFRTLSATGEKLQERGTARERLFDQSVGRYDPRPGVHLNVRVQLVLGSGRSVLSIRRVPLTSGIII